MSRSDEFEVVRELTGAEKRVLAIRKKRLQEAQRLIQSEMRVWGETIALLTGDDPELSVDVTRLAVVRKKKDE